MMARRTLAGFRFSQIMGRNSLVAAERAPVNIALFDGSTLLGKGVKAHLKKRRFPVGRVRAFDTGLVEEGGNLTEFGGEAMLAVRPDLEEMAHVDLAFFCGAAGTGEKFLDWPGRGGFVAIDLTQSANRRENVPIVNAWVNPAAARRHTGIVASPHPVAQFLSTFLAPLARAFPIREAVSLVMQPASEAGEEGIDELYRQTVGALNFTEVPKNRFARVLAFNLIPVDLGPGRGLAEESLSREIAAILGGSPFPHAVQVLLVPVFHCHSFCAWVRFEAELGQAEIQDALYRGEGLKMLQSEGAATPAELAGEDGIFVQVRADPSVPGAAWFWGVTDNLTTGAALNAVRVAEGLLHAGRLK
jgi:aspartate-semialdehyde dehydrogenase